MLDKTMNVQHLTRRPAGSDWHTQTRRKNSSMRIKLSPSAVHSDADLASVLCAGKFKVGYFLDSFRFKKVFAAGIWALALAIIHE
jgi:hypothetical protein